MSLSRIVLVVFLLAGCSQEPSPEPLDVVLVGGTVYSGQDEAPVVTDVGIRGDRITEIGDLDDRAAALRLDVREVALRRRGYDAGIRYDSLVARARLW